jgi:translation initiation factor 2-alpha kinase 4
MAPTNPWNNTKKKPITSSESSFPGLKPVASTETKSQYEEIQDNELIALESIYDEDFRRLETKGGAWKVSLSKLPYYHRELIVSQKAEPSFSIRIKSSDEELSVTLHVVFVATYPKSPPLLSLKDDDDLRDGTKYKLQKTIETKPKEMAAKEQEMIMEIVDALQEILEDAAKAKAAGKELPSLEEERATHEIAAARMAKEQEQEEERKRQDETREEERILSTMVQDELNRQRAKVKEAKKKSKPPAASKELFIDEEIEEPRERLIFDQPLTLMDEDNNPRLFQAVTDKVRIRRGPVSDCYTVRPILKGSHSVLVALKQTDLRCQGIENAQFKAQLRNLESTLEAVKKTKHRNILEILGFKVQKNMENNDVSDSTWTVSILSEYANKGSLEELLDIAGGLGVERVRAWTIELLDALRYLHDRGIVHQDLIASNILLVRSPSGDITAKLSDAGFQHQLYGLKDVGAVNTLTVAKSAYWLPPENANATNPQFTQKTDIWDFGIVFLQMIFGLGVLQKYASPDRVTEALNLSESLGEIVHKFFKTDPKKRPRAFELSSSEFLATDAPIMADDSVMLMSRFGSMTSVMPTTPGRPRHDSMNASVPFSRFKEDFTEEGRLGKGGFGEVVKARKKLDGQFYAIKKITQKSSASLTEVLKEVRLLSQLSHPYVVRYYNTWTEEVPEISDTDDDTTSTLEESTSALFPGPNIEFGASTGGLDFISSSGFPVVEFGYASDENAILDDDEIETEEEDDSTSQSQSNIAELDPPDGKKLALKRTRSDSRFQRSTRTILYIQ